MKLAATAKAKVLKHLEYWDVFIFMNIYLLIFQKSKFIVGMLLINLEY